MLVHINYEVVEDIVKKRLYELLYELDDPETFDLEAWDAAYTQDSIMNILEILLTDTEYQTLWSERHGIQENPPAV